MIKISTFLLAVLLLGSCKGQEDTHRDPTHNFTVFRLIILNDNDEMLMGREDYVWAPQAAIIDKREFVNETLHNLAESYGITIGQPELRGYFSYKYDYHPHATTRAYYVARYIDGEIKLAHPTEEIKWMPIEEAIEISTVTSIKQSTKQILDHPNTVWGGSFMVSRTDDGHPTEMVEEFYPLFQR